jgi:hypothetical protein
MRPFFQKAILFLKTILHHFITFQKRTTFQPSLYYHRLYPTSKLDDTISYAMKIETKMQAGMDRRRQNTRRFCDTILHTLVGVINEIVVLTFIKGTPMGVALE